MVISKATVNSPSLATKSPGMSLAGAAATPAVYGKCNNPNFHGHNYTLEVLVEGELDQSTGYLIDLKLLKTIIQTEIIERFDHRNLNLDCSEFATLIPTAENIAIVIYEILRNVLDPKYKISIKLWETENNMVFYDGK